MAKDKAYKPKRQYQPNNKKKINYAAWAVAIMFGGLMVTSTIGFIGSSSTGGSTGDAVLYGEHKLFRTQRGYGITINDVALEFSFLPDILESIPLDQEIINSLTITEAVIITYDPESPINGSAGLVQYNLEQLYNKVLGIYAQRALTNNTIFPSLDQADCSKATEFVPVLIFEQGNESRFYKEDNCVHVVSTHDQDLIRMNDRLSYTLLGVMSP